MRRRSHRAGLQRSARVVLLARALAVVGLGLGTGGCVPAINLPLPEDVAAAIAAHPMRHLETDDLRLYYPDGQQEEAHRFLARVEGCLGFLRQRAHVHNRVADEKAFVILPELPLNNAFVSPRLTGAESVTVVPTLQTLDAFTLEFGLPPDPGVVGCHEITHFVQFQQIAGFAWFWNTLFGDLYTPQIGLDPWFDEGLAVYYETLLQPPVGRLVWPLWRGEFAAAYAGKHLDGGDLSVFSRDFPHGNHYLVGSQFIRFLAARYGEDRLWKLIHVQARSWFFPLGVNVRFWQAYGKSLSTLIDEFADEVQAQLTPRARPVGQRTLRPLGDDARYARAPDGTEALITADHDLQTRLEIWSPAGERLVERDLADVVPPRKLAIASPSLTSGLSFTADSRSLYFVAVDLDPTYQAARLLRYDLATNRLDVVNRNVGGPGGSISPDGGQYIFARANGDHHDLATLDLHTGQVRILRQESPGAFVAGPRFSPDGARLVATRFDGTEFRIAVLDAHDGRLLTTISPEGQPVHDASWVDDRRIVYLGGARADIGFQVYLHDLVTGETKKVTEAPYVAFEPRAIGGTVRFLNRDGWHWTLDEVALPPPSPVPPPDPDAAPSPTPLATPLATPPRPWRPLPVSREPLVLSDEPASAFDHLLVPHLYGPTFATTGRDAFLIGAVLSGADRLFKHRWALAGYYFGPAQNLPSGSFAYANRQLAPVTLTLAAAEFQFHDIPPRVVGAPAPTTDDFTLYRRDRQLSVSAFRTFYENPVSLDFSLFETYRPDDPAVVIPLRRLAGPRLSAAYVGAVTSPYTGPRKLLALSGSFGGYPIGLSTLDFGFVDAAGAVAVTMPLPLTRRHTLTLSGRARALVGDPQQRPLLTVGGYGDLVTLARQANHPEIPVVTPDLLPTQPFFEPLRGFEDYPLLVDRIFIGEGTYRLPIIVDRGTASTLGILPAFFLRQFELQLFAVGATTARSGDRHEAVGGALSLRFALWIVPLTLQYQLSRRLTDDDALVHLVTLGP